MDLVEVKDLIKVVVVAVKHNVKVEVETGINLPLTFVRKRQGR